MAQKQSATIGKDALFAALADKNAGCPFSDEQLNALIEKELSKPADEMDLDKTDACYRLLERRHSPFSGRQLAKSERKSRARFKRFMKQHRALEAERKRLSLRPLAVAALIVLLIGGPALYVSRSYRVFTSPDQQQYVVVGNQTDDAGLAKASTDKSTAFTTININSLEEIPAYLGYTVQLPTWIPEGCALNSISIDRSTDDDSLFIEFTGVSGKSISISITLFSDRSGYAVSYEQEKNGHRYTLQNGSSVYIANNINSVWGLMQSFNMDYYIDAVGFDEATLIRIFNSIGR